MKDENVGRVNNMEDMRESEETAKKKVVLSSIIVIGVILVLFCVLIQKDMVRVVQFKPEELKNDSDVQVEVEKFVHGNYIQIEGYAYLPGETIRTVENAVVLHHIENDEYLKIPTQLLKREDLNEKFPEAGSDYRNAGFLGRIHRDQADLYQGSYEICFYYGNDGHNDFVRTGIIIGLKSNESKVADESNSDNGDQENIESNENIENKGSGEVNE